MTPSSCNIQESRSNEDQRGGVRPWRGSRKMVHKSRVYNSGAYFSPELYLGKLILGDLRKVHFVIPNQLEQSFACCVFPKNEE